MLPPHQENGDSNGRTAGKRENPHKYLLYKPTFSQLMAFLASGKTESDETEQTDV